MIILFNKRLWNWFASIWSVLWNVGCKQIINKSLSFKYISIIIVICTFHYKLFSILDGDPFAKIDIETIPSLTNALFSNRCLITFDSSYGEDEDIFDQNTLLVNDNVMLPLLDVVERHQSLIHFCLGLNFYNFYSFLFFFYKKWI